MSGKTWKKISVVLTAIVLIGAAWAVLEPYRFWAWSSDLEQVAGVSYETAIKWEQQNLRGTRFEIDKCVVNQNCPARTLFRLQREEQESLDKIEELKEEHEKMFPRKGG